MPKSTTSKKKPTTKVGGGGVNTKTSRFNLKIAIPVVLLVAALGGFYIFKKSSASSYTFTRRVGAFSADPNVKVISKTGQPSYYIVGEAPAVEGIKTWLTWSEINSSERICVHMLGSTNSGVIIPLISFKVQGVYYEYYPFQTWGATANNWCANMSEYKNKYNGKSAALHILAGTSGSSGLTSSSAVYVDTAYGLPAGR